MADKRFNLVFDVDANIGPVKNAVSGLQGALNKINIPDSFRKNLDTTFTKLNTEIENFEAIASKGFSNMADVGKAEKSFGKITDLLSKLKIQVTQLKGINPNKFLPEENIKRIKELQQSWNKLKSIIEKGSGGSTEINKQTQELAKQERELKELETKYNALAAANQRMGATKGTLSKSLTADRKEADALVEKMSQLEKIKGGKSTAEYKSMAADFKTLSSTIDRNQKQFDDLGVIINKNQALMTSYKTQIKATEDNIKDINQTLEQLKNAAAQTPEELEHLRKKLAEIKGVNIDEIPTDIDQIGQEINSLNEKPLKEIGQDLERVGNAADQADGPVHALGIAIGDVKDQANGINARAQEIEQLANRVKYFFSIGNTVQLFKRAIKSAFDTVKELDAVMTQTAVVTKYSVADMWSQLPEYTKRANELGVSVKGAYEAATLYYQQGLETNEVIGVSNETLKMAKIAAIDYATATDYMTSALRGFNMEVNEASAQKINDIYSQLAAKTAADTEEISIAMSKTAPLAHNAGMEIETTAALLSQMIETTREAPETLGTAMKTVIARFQELKKDPALIEPVEGEIVDANKIEGALRTIGVALRDTGGQFRDLDDVFLEISQKWDSLDTNTQRYIATLAAGSRQQSRFIAMMSNYERTVELVGLANNSAGASQQQFEKTLDSMQSKLDRMKNAWNEYVMGLANNAIIKTAVDLLTGFLNMVNKIGSSASGKKGVFKSLIDIGLLATGIKLAKATFNGFFGWLVKTGKSSGTAAGTATGQGFGAGINKTLHSAQRIFSKSFWRVDKEELANLKAAQMAFEDAKKSGLDAATATEIYNAALNRFGATLSLTNEQLKVSKILQEAGVDVGLANIAAVSGLTEAEIVENIVTDAGGKIDEKATREKLKQVAATKAQEGAEKRLLGLGLIDKGKAIIALLFQTSAAKRKEAMESLGLAAANTTATGTQWSLNAALEACPIGWIILGIAALTAGIILLAKHEKNISLEGRMKAAAEETKRAKEAADEAKNIYDQLLNDRSGYDETQKALEDLTYGTQEWKQALIEANEQVLKLLQTYPKLAQFLERGQYGQLTVSNEGWKSMIEQQQRAVLRTHGAVALNQINEEKIERENLDENLDKNFRFRVADSYYIDNAKGAIRQLIDSGFTDFSENSPALQKIAETSLLTAKQLVSAAKAMMEYDEAVKANQIQMENTAKAFLTTALTPDNSERLEDAAENIIGAFTKNLLESSDEDLDDLSDNIRTNNEERQKIASELNIVLGGNRKNQIQQIYAELTNKTLEEVKQMKLSKEQLAKEIAKYQNSENISKDINKFAESFINLPQEAQKAVNLAMSQGADYILAEELDSETLQTIYDANEKTFNLIYKTFDEFANAYNEAVENGKVEIEEARSSLRSLNIVGENFGEGLTANAISGLSSNLMQVFEVSGSRAAATLADIIQNIINNLDTENAQKFVTTLNGINWKNIDSIEGLSDILDDLGISLKGSGVNVDDLEQEIIQLAKAAKDVDLEKVIEQIRSLSKIQYDILKGTQGRDFSEEDYQLLIEEGIASAADFVYNLATDSWTYIGESMDELSAAINNNTKSLLGLDQLRRGFTSSKAAEKISNEYSPNTRSATEMANAIKAYINQAGEDSIIDSDWLSKNRRNTAALLDKWKEILGEATALEARKEEYERATIQGRRIQLQSENTLQENLSLALTGDEDALAAFQAQAKASGILDDTYNKLVGTIATVSGIEKEHAMQILADIALIYEEADALGIEKDQLALLTDQYLKNNKMASKNLAQVTASALNNIKLTNGLKKLVSSYEDWSDVLDKLEEKNGKISELTDIDDVIKINELKSSLAQILNTDMPLSDEFFANNLTILKNVAKGAEGALNDLYEAASKEIRVRILSELDEKDLNKELKEAIRIVEEFNPGSIQVGATLNSGPFINALKSLLEATSLTATQVNTILNSMGFEVSIEEAKPALPVKGSKYSQVELGASTASTYSISATKLKPPDYTPYTSSGGGGSEVKDWENTYDWLYNLTQQINSELRTREKLERRYQQLLKTYTGTGSELKEIIDQEIASLEKRKKLQEDLIALRKKELNEYLAANKTMLKYATADLETLSVKISWNTINSVKDPEEGERIEKYISQLEKILEEIKDAEDQIDDINDNLIDIKNRGKEQYRDLEDRVLSALISEQQELIDEQEKISDSIDKASSSLIDAISKNIDKLRQDRQNEETEASLAEKERRLAYLRQDTTGSNALEIKKLEKDLAKERQDYSDSLVDQALNDLKDQNDAAARQRERQIEYMQSQLDWQERTGYWVEEATRIVQEGLGPDGVMSENTRLYQLLKAQEGYDRMSNASRAQWIEDLRNTLSEAFAYFDNLVNPKEPVKEEIPNGIDYSTDYAAEMIKAIDARDFNRFGELEQLRNKKIQDQGLENEWPETHMYEQYQKGKASDINMAHDYMADLETAMQSGDWKNVFYYAGQRDAKIAMLGEESPYEQNETLVIAFKKWYNSTQGKIGFKTGGLADFTGPAWLDGSKSNPELVLSAKDTQNFIQLKDILANLRSGIVGASQSGDWYFDIDINVDEISNDYDVDRIVTRVKQSIYEESSYRNVNALNFLK